jgi:hypothetical protein
MLSTPAVTKSLRAKRCRDAVDVKAVGIFSPPVLIDASDFQYATQWLHAQAWKNGYGSGPSERDGLQYWLGLRVSDVVAKPFQHSDSATAQTVERDCASLFGLLAVDNFGAKR